MNDESLASELLHQIKMNAQRWFIAFCVMVVVEIITVAGFMWYLSLPVEEVNIDNESGNANYVGRDLEGGLYNGEDSSKEESGQE